MRSYQNLLTSILEFGEGHDDRTGVGTTSIFGYQWSHPMSLGFPLLTTKKLPLRWIAEELIWFLSGSTDEKALRSKGVDIWAEWATAEQCEKFGRKEGDLGPVYGSLWRNFGGYHDGDGVDQIKRLFDQLEINPSSRRLIVTGWDPENCDQVALPPCHTLWQMKVHQDNSLSLQLYARSIDAFLGLPFNIASYALLLNLVAFCTAREAKKMIVSFGDLHIYNNHRDQVASQLKRSPKSLPILKIDDRLWNSGLEGLLSFQWSDIELIGYEPHPKIKADVAV